MNEKPWLSPSKCAWVRLLAESHQRMTGRALLPSAPQEARAFTEYAFRAPQALLAHGTESDPVLCYANQTVLELWEYSWNELLNLPSRLTAEPLEQVTREAFLKAVREKGFVADYRGVRISKSGRRFWIEKVTVWNVVDAAGIRHGQAATFTEWKYI